MQPYSKLIPLEIESWYPLGFCFCPSLHPPLIVTSPSDSLPAECIPVLLPKFHGDTSKLQHILTQTVSFSQFLSSITETQSGSPFYLLFSSLYPLHGRSLLPFSFFFSSLPFYNKSVHFLKFIYFYLEDNCFTILNWFLPYINIISHRYARVPSLQSVHFIFNIFSIGLPGGSVIKNLPMMQETQVQSLGQEDPLEESMARHSSILAWRIPWTEEPGGLQSIGSQRVGHNWSNLPCTHAYSQLFMVHNVLLRLSPSEDDKYGKLAFRLNLQHFFLPSKSLSYLSLFLLFLPSPILSGSLLLYF